MVCFFNTIIMLVERVCGICVCVCVCVFIIHMDNIYIVLMVIQFLATVSFETYI